MTRTQTKKVEQTNTTSKWKYFQQFGGNRVKKQGWEMKATPSAWCLWSCDRMMSERNAPVLAISRQCEQVHIARQRFHFHRHRYSRNKSFTPSSLCKTPQTPTNCFTESEMKGNELNLTLSLTHTHTHIHTHIECVCHSTNHIIQSPSVVGLLCWSDLERENNYSVWG